MTEPDLAQLFGLLLEQLPLGLVITDSDGNIVFVNQTAEKVRQVDREHLIGRNMVFCHPQKSHENVARAVAHMKSRPGTSYRRMVEDSVNNRHFTNTYSSIVDHENVFRGMVVITEDVTEKRRLEQEEAQLVQIQNETINNLKLQYHKLLVTTLETMASILETRDIYTRDHSENVCRISKKMYEHKFGITAEYNEISTAALLHDIGKICIPDRILEKPSKLTPAEYEQIKYHSVIAESILKPLDMGKIASIVKHHHERYDGKGYPDGISGDAIPLGSRIIAIADTFDAMRSDRPYRKALPYNDCLEEIQRESGKQFDPYWVEVFSDLAKTGSL